MLLRYDASSRIINGTAQIPKDVTEDDEIITMLEGMKGLDFFPSFFLSPADLAVFLPLSQCFALHSRREKRDTAAGGEATGSGQRRRHPRSVQHGQEVVRKI